MFALYCMAAFPAGVSFAPSLGSLNSFSVMVHTSLAVLDCISHQTVNLHQLQYNTHNMRPPPWRAAPLHNRSHLLHSRGLLCRHCCRVLLFTGLHDAMKRELLQLRRQVPVSYTHLTLPTKRIV
eukprot:TRINITY_DN13560_c0_g1_i2.p1 TRINITY_DN13560_c0_g1~~TRINITY_DN13560_c0_g1_i2.p1  ORF type:complete len:124 (+),score=8.28 TRINITY_DN13560_c0_g1_i2:133-504(+)